MSVVGRKRFAQVTALVLVLTGAGAPQALLAQGPSEGRPGAHAGARPGTQPAAAAKLDDPTIVAIFDAANTWDMETGALAAKKGSTQDVREFGRMLVRDHRVVRQQGRDLAKQLGVQPTPPKDFALAKAHADAMTRLQAADGAAFDRAFLQNEVAFHKAVIDAVTSTLLPATQNADLKALEVRVAPAFQAHMMHAQSMLDAMGK